jgi:hypothetical protein
MTKDEALKLALEALEDLGMKHYENTGEVLYKETFTAIKAALEAKDEPVAWSNAEIRLGEELSSVGPDGYYDMDAKEWFDWAMKQKPRGEHSLPQRTWVNATTWRGLTDGEVDKMILLMGFPPDWITENAIVKNIVRNLEAKLKAKNSL